jgi:hypothetical protein
MADEKSLLELPQGLEPPVILGGGAQRFEAWQGKTTFRSDVSEAPGEARVFLDLMPTPEFRFEFTPDCQPSIKDMFQCSMVENGTLECGPPIGAVNCFVTQAGSQYSGLIKDQLVPVDVKATYNSATFLILNGPIVDGKLITRGQSSFRGRMSARVEGIEITVDRLSGKMQPRHSIYEGTHVALCAFPEPVPLARVDLLARNLFRSLSLMKCRWVGLLGPWLLSDTACALNFRVSVTKSMRNGGASSWCHESMGNCFSDLAPAIFASFADESRAAALQTALHWLIESEQCAGGVEGAIILQQAALECLAWLEVVVTRKQVGKKKFGGLKASDKIHQLLSLSRIESRIPEQSQPIKAYADDHSLTDLIDVLVHVRNALVHAEPGKTTRLLGRRQGNEERSDLWFQVGGILQQALLASIGYRGPMFRRDVDAKYSSEAVRPVPWAV